MQPIYSPAYKCRLVQLRIKLTLTLALACLLSACLAAPQTSALRNNNDASLSAPAFLFRVPFFAQDLYQCGPAALAMMLSASQLDVMPEELVPLVYVPGREGSFQVEIAAATRSHARMAYRVTPTLDALFREVAAGQPALILQNLGLEWYPRWHFAVVKGFDLQRNRVILNSGLIENYEMKISTFERTWARADHWAILTLVPGTMPAAGEPTAYFSALAALEQTRPSAPLEAAYVNGLQQWPDDINLRMGYGNLLYTRGGLQQATLQFEHLLAQYPDYAPAHNNLAQIYMERNQNDQAVQHARQAVALGGHYLPSYLATLQTIETNLRSANAQTPVHQRTK